MRRLVLMALIGLSAFARPSTIGAQSYGPAPSPATQRVILALREKAWRAWFANDSVAFKQAVPAELIALGWDGGAWEDRAQTITGMGEFAKSGMKLEHLEFTRNVFQQYGDAVILYTAFRLVLAGPNGQKQETTGRGTEIFVRRDGRWVHTGWHLDTVGS